MFITYRTLDTEASVGIDSHGQEVDARHLSYTSESFDEVFVTGPEVYQIIKRDFPMYEPSGYLGGTERHDSYKWLAGAMIGSKHRMYGSIGKKTMEIAQSGHHLFYGTYLAYLPQMKAASLLFLMAFWDRTVRRTLKKRLADVVLHPTRLFSRLRLQTVGII